MNDLRKDLNEINAIFKKHGLLNQTVYAKKIGVTKQTLRYRVKAGLVKHIRLGETVFIIP